MVIHQNQLNMAVPKYPITKRASSTLKSIGGNHGKVNSSIPSIKELLPTLRLDVSKKLSANMSANRQASRQTNQVSRQQIVPANSSGRTKLSNGRGIVKRQNNDLDKIINHNRNNNRQVQRRQPKSQASARGPRRSSTSKSKTVKDPKDDPFHCQFCKKSFDNKETLDAHFNSAGVDKPFQCPHCCKSFLHKGNLNAHLRTHTGEKPFQCVICSRRFSRKVNLDRHHRTHTGEKPFACVFCPKAFSQKVNLDRHIARHTDKLVLNGQTDSKAVIDALRVLRSKQPGIVKNEN